MVMRVVWQVWHSRGRILTASAAVAASVGRTMPPPPQVLALGGAAAAVGIGYALHRAHERAASEAAKADEARMNEELKRNRERSAEARQVRRLPAGPSCMTSVSSSLTIPKL